VGEGSCHTIHHGITSFFGDLEEKNSKRLKGKKKKKRK